VQVSVGSTPGKRARIRSRLDPSRFQAHQVRPAYPPRNWYRKFRSLYRAPSAESLSKLFLAAPDSAAPAKSAARFMNRLQKITAEVSPAKMATVRFPSRTAPRRNENKIPSADRVLFPALAPETYTATVPSDVPRRSQIAPDLLPGVSIAPVAAGSCRRRSAALPRVPRCATFANPKSRIFAWLPRLVTKILAGLISRCTIFLRMCRIQAVGNLNRQCQQLLQIPSVVRQSSASASPPSQKFHGDKNDCLHALSIS